MDLIEKYYGKEIFVLYALFANVPGKRTWPRKIFVTFSLLILFLATFLQVLILVIKKFQQEVIIEFLPTTVATAGTLIYIPYVIYATDEEYRVLLSLMVNDLREEKTKEEYEIKRKYAENIRMCTRAFFIIFGSAMFGIPLSGFVPCFLDLLMPLNETRGGRMLVSLEILFDQEKFFYQIYCFESSIVFLLGIIIGVTETMAVTLGQHACSMMAVTGYRLENLTRIQDHKILSKSDFMQLMTRRLYRCIEGHQRSLKYATLFASFYDFPMTLVLTATFSALSVSLTQATDPELTNTTIVFFTFAQIFQLFIISYLGQSTIDSSRNISVDAYNSDWYVCTPSLRKLLQMIILRSAKPYAIIVKGMYTLSVENFMAVMQTVISFYMVLRQT